MVKTNKLIGFLVVGSIVISFMMLSACGGFGGRYKIECAQMDNISTGDKIPANVRLVLKPELCNYTYTSRRQGAKRVYELGDALCTSTKDLFTTLFENVIVISNENYGKEADFDATVIPKVIATSVLIRPGAPPNYEATVIYECSITDKNNRTIFLRTVKEDKVYEGYGYKGYGIVMQQAVDELFNRLGNELMLSPEVKQFAGSLEK